MNNPFDGPYGGFGFFWPLGVIAWGFLSLIAFAVIVGLIFLLVRFLLIGTRAAQLYIATNEPVRPAPPTSTTTAAPVPAAPPAQSATVPAPAATPTQAAAPTRPAATPRAQVAAPTPTATTPTTPLPAADDVAANTTPAAAKPAAKPRLRKIPPASDPR